MRLRSVFRRALLDEVVSRRGLGGSARDDKQLGIVCSSRFLVGDAAGQEQKSTPVNAFFQELFRVGLYKRTQGRIARQVTFAAIAVCLLAGAYQLYGSLVTMGQLWRLLLPSALIVVGIWVAYRLVNLPAFADFLIAVEAEMNKVSWPTRAELYRSSAVVLVTVFVLAALLFAFDVTWRQIFMTIDIVPGDSVIERLVGGMFGG